MRHLIQALLIAALPICVLILGAACMNQMTHQRPLDSSLARCASTTAAPLYARCTGYSVADAVGHWQDQSARDSAWLERETQALQLDLGFPLLYGLAMFVALTAAWVRVDEPFALAWFYIPLGLAMLADWTENLVLLQQLAAFSKFPEVAGLSAEWIQIASLATICKLWLLLGLMLILFGLLGCWLLQRIKLNRSIPGYR